MEATRGSHHEGDVLALGCEHGRGDGHHHEKQRGSTHAQRRTQTTTHTEAHTQRDTHTGKHTQRNTRTGTHTEDTHPEVYDRHDCGVPFQDMVSKYRCGAEFLPSPLASKSEFALTSDPAYSRKGHLTAVAVAVETEHAVAFLGTGEGEVLKLHLSSRPEVYGRTPSDGSGGRVNKNLLLSSHLTHLYVATETKVSCRGCGRTSP